MIELQVTELRRLRLRLSTTCITNLKMEDTPLPQVQFSACGWTTVVLEVVRIRYQDSKKRDAPDFMARRMAVSQTNFCE
jgi:hypothetical protein